MQHEWLIDVLADLQAFAEAKGMRASSSALQDAGLVVLAELSSKAHAEVARLGAGDREGAGDPGPNR